MPSKKFKAKYDGQCATCGSPYHAGDELVYLGYKDQGPSHADHLHDYRASPPLSSTGGPKPGPGFSPDTSAPVAALPLGRDDEPTIYTYHRRVRGGGTWYELGVSTKGRRPTDEERKWVDEG